MCGDGFLRQCEMCPRNYQVGVADVHGASLLAFAATMEVDQ